MENLIKTYGLSPHPEGGFYREIYRSNFNVRSDRATDTRASVTQIYFLLASGQISRFHRVVHDEIWHHYQGAPLTLLRFDGTGVTTETIGPGQDHFTAVVPGMVWQAAESTGDFSFVGCTVAPGFDFRDFSFLSDYPEEAKALQGLEQGYHRFI